MARGTSGNRRTVLDPGLPGIGGGTGVTGGGMVMPPVAPPWTETLQERMQREERVLEGQGKRGFWVDRGRQLVYQDPAVMPPVFGPTGVVGVYSVFRRAVWQSPLFDAREALWLQSGEAGGTQPVQEDAKFSIRWVLQVMIQGAAYAEMQASGNLMVSYLEFGHPNQPSAQQYYTANQDLTTEFNAGNQAVLLPFSPTGITSPLRYWGVTLVFDYVQFMGGPVPTLPTNPVEIYASLH